MNLQNPQEFTRALRMVKDSSIEFIDSLLTGVSVDSFELWDDLVELKDMVEQDEITPHAGLEKAVTLFKTKNN
tara:strand:- start:50 stop:268 length:219 start_codon:yes stop_codon:yes gene_type:complete